MKVVLAPVGTRGDVQPMVALAVALQERGHTVLLVTSAAFETLARQWNVPFLAAGQDVQAWTEQHAREVSRHPIRRVRALNQMLKEEIRGQFEVLVESTRGADFLIGAGLQFAGPSVAEAAGVPYRYAIYAPQVLESDEHPAPIVPCPHLPRLLNRVSWWLFRKLYNAVFRGKVNRYRASLGLAPCSDFLRMTMPDNSFLAADVELVPLPSRCRQSPVVTGSWILPDREPLPADLERFLDQGPPAIFFGLGSMTDPDRAATSELVLQAARAVGRRLVLSRGWAGYELPQPATDAFVIGAVNHQRLFPRVAAVVHHGGAGTVSAAARAGAPQIIVPHLGDQFVHARRMHQLGVAPLPFNRRQLSFERLSAALRHVLETPSVAMTAAALGKDLRQKNGARAAVEQLEADVSETRSIRQWKQGQAP